MKVCICDAGAVGGYHPVQLHRAGADVSVVAWGERLGAMRRTGLLPKIDGEPALQQSAAPTMPASWACSAI